SVPFFPDNIREEFENKYGEYTIYPDYNAKNVHEFSKVAADRAKMAEMLDEKIDWDLLTVQFQVTDSAFHTLDDRDSIKEVYKNVDSYIGRIRSLDPEANILVVSDHGMGDYKGTFYTNSWLHEKGYCELKQGGSKYFAEEKKNLAGDEQKQSSARAIRSISRALSYAGLTPKRIHQTLSYFNLASVIEQRLPQGIASAVQTTTVDWEKSQAFQILYNSWGITINTETEGALDVNSEEYLDFREELITKLNEIRKPDGDPLFQDVLPKEDVYSGEYLSEAPDIILVPDKCEFDISGSIMEIFSNTPHKNHKFNPHIYDIAPTISSILGIPLDTARDGNVLPLVTESTESADWRSVSGFETTHRGKEESDKVEERLKQLGYKE
ncbi:MAG: alkaline phosphatase family protein, partial [Halobacteriaceae archaeon]